MSSPRRLAAALVAVVLVGCALLAGQTAGAAPAPGNDLVPDRTTGLSNGAAVTLSASGYKPGSAVTVLQCRQGSYPVGGLMVAPVTYAGHQVERWYADCDPDAPDSKVDNSGRAQLGVADATGRMTVVSYVRDGTLAANRPDTSYVNVPVSFTCDDTSPCTLVVIDAHTYRTLQSSPITFAPSASTQCAAPTDSTATGVGPYSVTPTYQRWAAASCATGTASPLLADYTDTGEEAGLTTFASGQSDYAVSAAGFTSAGQSDVPDTRSAVFTPLAAEGAVIAFDGNSVLQDTVSGLFAAVPITDLSLTMSEVAGLFSNPSGTSGLKSPQIVARNPQLTRLTSTFGNQATIISPDGVIATPDATVLAMTTAWSALPHSPWTHGVLRGFPSSLGTNAHSTSAIPLLSNLPALSSRVLGSIFTANATPAHQVFLYLTDSATAAQLGLRVAKIENASHAFVAPTAASIAAGVAGMKPGPDGVLAPDAANPDPAAYPLPLVQYAVTPHGSFDAARRTQLTQFLTYATTKGQRAQDLAPGMFALPAGLQADAAASLPLIGTAVDPTTAAPAGTLPTATGPALPSLSLTGLPTTPTLPGLPRSTVPLPAGAVGAANAAAAATPAPVAIPAFSVASQTPLRSLLPAGGVVVLAALLCLASYVSSGRALPLAAPAGLRRGVSRVRRLLPGRRGA